MPTRFNDQTKDQIIDDFGPDCNDEAWELLNIYADGEASPEQAAHVEDLLKSDALYARQLSFMRTASAAVQSFVEVDPPSSLRDAILASTSQRITWAANLVVLRDAIRTSLRPRFATSLAGLAAAGLLALVLVQHGTNRPNNMNNGNPVLHAAPSSSYAAAEVRDFTENVDPSLDLSSSAPSVISNVERPHASNPRTQLAIARPHLDRNSPRPSLINLSAAEPEATVRRHEDGSGVAVAAAYRPDMDAQFERNPGTVAQPSTQPVEIPGEDVRIADSDPMPAPASVRAVGSVDSVMMASNAPAAKHIIVARLTALPPDPNQVLTRADMARNRAVLPSGYDRSALSSMESKAPSISFLHGSF